VLAIRHLTSLFERSGRASSNSVTIPATTAEACDAPLVIQSPVVVSSIGSSMGRSALSGSIPAKRTPGATRFGLIWPEAAGPLPENGATSTASPIREIGHVVKVGEITKMVFFKLQFLVSIS